MNKTKMDFQTYLTHPAISGSDLIKIQTTSPAEYREYKDNPPAPTDAMIFGTMFHTMVLEPQDFRHYYCELSPTANRASLANREQLIEEMLDGVPWREPVPDNNPTLKPDSVRLDDWIARLQEAAAHAGTVFVSSANVQRAEGMLESLRKNSLAWGLLEGAITERTIFGKSTYHGLELKARIDAMPTHLDHVIVELKTAADGSYRGFANQAVRLNYHTKASFYRNLWSQNYGRTPMHYTVVVGTAAPYPVAVYSYDRGLLMAGQKVWKEGLELMGQCVNTNFWPGPGYDWASGLYYHQELKAPRWMQDLDIDDDTNDGPAEDCWP